MNKMKVYLRVPLFTIILVFTWLFYVPNNIRETKSASNFNTLNYRVKASKVVKKNTDFLNENLKISVMTSIQENVIYDIKGSLSKLTRKQIEIIEKGRESLVKNVRNKVYKNIFINGPTKRGNTVALTFDDGPDAKNTEKIIRILRDHKIQATFFMIGSNAKNFPNVVKDASQEGNLVLGHSYSHPHFIDLKTSNLIHELNHTDKILNQIIGEKPTIIRPPYGEVNTDVMHTLNKNGYTTVMWSNDSLDWANPKNKEYVIKNVVDNIRPGDIVLMHSTKDITVEALPEIIDKLEEKGYNFLRIDEMLKVRAFR